MNEKQKNWYKKLDHMKFIPRVPKLVRGVYGKQYDKLTCATCGKQLDETVEKFCKNCGQAQYYSTSACSTNMDIRKGYLVEGEYLCPEEALEMFSERRRKI